jgi:hypothetical protein
MKIICLLLCLGFAPLSGFAVNFDSNVPQAVKDQILGDLEFMRGIKSTKVTPLHKEIYGIINGDNYFNFFDSRVKSVGLSSCGSANAVACVQPFFDPSKIWLTPNYTKFSHPQIAKMMVVFHEARHTESQNGNWGHASCPSPFLDADGRDMKSIWTGASLAGQPACDSTPKGSYGSSTIMLKNIAKFCETCSDKVKEDAGIYSDDQLKRVTNANAKAQMLKDFETTLQ